MKKLMLVFAACIAVCGCQTQNALRPTVRVAPVPDQLMTAEIQKAIDGCAEKGGGVVEFPAGNYLTGGLHLRSNVTLLFDKGATLTGSGDYQDYGKWDWGNALIKGEHLTNIAIRGQGTLDGVSCRCRFGEEKFRGPHCIRLVDCDGIVISGIKIVRSANWAINCLRCRNARVERVTILGGHDGLHSRFGANFYVEGCDFRTGDDAFAGNDNQNFTVRNCKINTSCNGFRFGCLDLLVEDCRIWGPGEYRHQISKRDNTLAAFVHFSPQDVHPKLESGNWLIKNVTVDAVDQFYVYDYRKGNWQTGRPVTTVRFENIRATNVKKAFTVVGDAQRQFQLSVSDASFSAASGPLPTAYEGVPIDSPAFCNFDTFGLVRLCDVRFDVPGPGAVLRASNGDTVILRGTKSPADFQHVTTVLH
jgi:hypothetical protein